eukprot:TRINITY_DN15333_c0_g1_i1.p1 TRINITY_DN15333_c0_g1~~TRINITY_DN15333_c0_g1_i1.p1  ORF type:complete len:164 (+),score=26.33 TRINITY_DN15333_c0_g1_i1:724-1215(+)
MKAVCVALALLAVVLAVAPIVADAHLCMLFPPQREGYGGAAINTAAEMSCFRLKPPCGLNTFVKPTVSVNAGTAYNITFQKNLSHWNSSNPGKFIVSYSPRWTDPHFKPVATISDTSAPSLTLYTTNITIPTNMISLHGVLQVQYVTNSGVGPFYQCADITVL